MIGRTQYCYIGIIFGCVNYGLINNMGNFRLLLKNNQNNKQLSKGFITNQILNLP